jgi:predicted aldo/keto reductase-like oxidoreductase
LAAAENGALKVLYKMRDQKVARFIGITCHSYPAVLKMALERHDFDATQMALNAARAGETKLRPQEQALDPLERGFENVALPVALRKKMGVIAMKVFAQEKLLPKASVEKLVQYSLSLPITAIVLGMPKVEHIDENIRLAKSLKPMSADEMRSLSKSLASTEKASLDRYFADHVDA